MTVVLVLAMIVVFLLIDFIYQKKFAKESVLNRVSETAAVPTASQAGELAIPQSLFFGRGHTWVSLRSSGNVQIGADEFMKKMVGKIDKISMNPVGTKVKKGDTLFSVEKNGRKLNFASPVTGIVYSLNDTMLDHPDTFSTTKYENSWLCTVKPENLSAEIKMLKIADEAVSWIKDEMVRFKDFIAGAGAEKNLVGATLQDGGMPVAGVVGSLDEGSWKKFEQEFLSE